MEKETGLLCSRCGLAWTGVLIELYKTQETRRGDASVEVVTPKVFLCIHCLSEALDLLKGEKPNVKI